MSEGDVEESTPEDMALPAVDNGASLEPIKVADEGFRALADAYKNKNEEVSSGHLHHRHPRQMVGHGDSHSSH